MRYSHVVYSSMNHPLADRDCDRDRDLDSDLETSHPAETGGATGGDERRPLLAKVRTKVDEVKQVMAENIDKMLDRGERFSALESKTTSLQETSNMFQRGTRSMRNRMSLADAKMKIIAGSVFLLVLVIIAIVVRWSKASP